MKRDQRQINQIRVVSNEIEACCGWFQVTLIYFLFGSIRELCGIYFKARPKHAADVGVAEVTQRWNQRR